MKKIKFICEFGFSLFVVKIFLKIFFNNEKISKKLINKKNDLILKKLYKENSNIIKKYGKNKKNIKNGKNVWILWWQGEENAPNLVRNCIYSIKKYNNNVNVVTNKNYNQYIKIEDLILKKFENNVITIQNFSDIIRMKLLSKYGGFWIDATIFLSDNIFDEIKKKSFFTPKPGYSKSMNVSDGKWCGFFIGGYDVNLYSFVSECFSNYWKIHNIIIDYFLIDYFIALAYSYIPSVKINVDSNDFNNGYIYKLNEIKNEKYNTNRINELLKVNKIHKMSYKDYLNKDDKNSVYNKLINLKK